MTLDRRNPHQPFDASLIAGFLRGRGVRSVDLLQAGKINTNYKLVLTDGLACVLRLYSRSDAAREVYVMGLVRDFVPVPVELDRGDGWSIFEFLEGELLENAPQHSAAAGEALARIASVAFESPGMINADGSISSFDFGGRGFIHQQLENADVLRWIGREAAESVLSILDRESERRSEIGVESRLVHGDFNATNILIRGGAVSGILDWEFGMSGTPYMDIGNLLRNTPPRCHDLVQKGLRAGGMDLPDDWKQRAELVDLGSHLEYLTSTRSDEFKRQCVARVRRFISMFGGS
ncbi:MAG: aminoglycoside phosphotransferase family protein [SAR202 cluster bacterium]|jgi:Ser/Thr protein kinase RdoA (MazF antagonist)|nr:aminoglycoside phosphotransferase family protein [SAR202 cluster bacterium]MDP6798492.1 aminoglycoside phosphotransferase family protein [SAR202 cluster bacterium]|tara:strand:+ start:13178 stop:14053 length:876 start_codon:yes stop_codon:yes gene_type:complete